jgi:predicted transcriptional regulator
MKKRISQAEFTVMEVLWADSPLAASDVAKTLDTQQDWNIRTVKTLLARLVEKGALSTKQDGRRFLYSPLLSRAKYAQSVTRSLSDRLFGGRAAPLPIWQKETD